MSNILDVRNMKISFRTNNGTVKAVRDISFELKQGETLAIVGESGSGKSVTARAVLGILAPNSIVENGEIIYDGKDLLKISEDEFHEYRGNKLSMIFQDPMSSLNPIMKIGKQLTEAMILNGKSNQKTAKKEYNDKIHLLDKCIYESIEGDKEQEKQVTKKQIEILKKFILCANKLETSYNEAHESITSLLVDIDCILTDIKKENPENVRNDLKEAVKDSEGIYHDFLVKKDKSDIPELIKQISLIAENTAIFNTVNIINILKSIKTNIEKILKEEKPNFFSMGYFLTFKPFADVASMPVGQLNNVTRQFLDDDFMLEFLRKVKRGIKYSHDKSKELKRKSIVSLKASEKVFINENLDYKECMSEAKKLTKIVNDTIDRLSIHKDSTAYIFETSLINAIDTYFKGIPNNRKEEIRFEKESLKRNKLIAKGKDAPKVVPAVIIDLDMVKENIKTIITRLRMNYEKDIQESSGADFDSMAVEMIDYLKKQASSMVYKVSKKTAYNKAVKLMEDVGIPEPRKRFKQFPFQFSGGMRQRIVIAIALAANPDILICDEPTTALDVTIQAQILELINEIKTKRQLSVIFITHDLGVVANMADRIAVMYAGKIVEYGTVEEIFYAPAHPYTWALLSSMPDLDTKEKLEAIPGTPPNMIFPPEGDAFADRNKYAMKIDYEMQPPLYKISETHSAATWLLHPNAPKVEPPKAVLERIDRMKRLEAEANG